MGPVVPATGPSKRGNRLNMSNLVKRMDLRQAKAALAWMTWGSQLRLHPEPRAVPSARPAPFRRAIRFALLALVLGGVFLWSAPAQAQTATVLISNTGQTSVSNALPLTTGNPKRAQAFTTGTYANGYTLDSIDFDFGDIADIMTAGAHLTVTLNGDSSGNPGNPGTALCTLTDPATFSGSGVQTFDAPVTDPCPTLTATTTYFAVIERVVFPTPDSSISLNVTTSADEDSGGPTGWSIGNTRHWFTTFWNSTGLQSHQIEVSGSAVVVNTPPAFSEGSPTTRSVDENTASAMNIGAAVAATDVDNDTLVYGLTGTDASSFSIDSTSGQLKTDASLDFETDGSYSVNVTVHDGKDATGGDDTTVDATIVVTISINTKLELYGGPQDGAG